MRWLGGRGRWADDVVDAFGNALGQGLVDQIQQPSQAETQGVGPYSELNYRNGSDFESDNVYYERMTQQALRDARSAGPGLSDSPTNAEVMAYRMGEAGYEGAMTPTAWSSLSMGRGPLSFGQSGRTGYISDQTGQPSLDSLLREANAQLDAAITDRLNRESVIRETVSPQDDGITGPGLQVGGSSGNGLFTRFASGAAHGAVDMVWQPVAQVLDLGQVAYGVSYNLLTDGVYEPHWFSGIGQNYAAGMGYGETITRAVLGSNPVTGVGLASYDLTSGALRGDWGGVAEGAGGLVGGFATAKFGQRYFAPEPGAQLGIYRAAAEVPTTNPLVDPGGLLPPLPAGHTPNFSSADPVFIGGKPLYRVSDGVFGSRTEANANGSYWADQPAPSTEAAWRSRYAVLSEWPNRGGVEGTWVPEGQWAWGGPAAPQGITGSYREFTAFGSTYRYGWIQPGGDYQIWVPDAYNTITPSSITLNPTPWKK